MQSVVCQEEDAVGHYSKLVSVSCELCNLVQVAQCG